MNRTVFEAESDGNRTWYSKNIKNFIDNKLCVWHDESKGW